MGAADTLSFQSPSSLEWYVVIANGEDDTGNTNIDSVVYQWNGTALQAVQSQLPTRGASALETYLLDGQLYLAVASVTDTRYAWLWWGLWWGGVPGCGDKYWVWDRRQVREPDCGNRGTWLW